MLLSCDLSPDEYGRGTNPSQEDRCRRLRNSLASPAAATIAVAVIGPMPPTIAIFMQRAERFTRERARAAAHRSSKLQVVEVGRGTEIDHLDAAVVRMGKRHGAATTSNAALAGLVRAREDDGRSIHCDSRRDRRIAMSHDEPRRQQCLI